MLINWIHKNHSGIFNDISRERKLIPEIERHLKTILIDFENLWKSGVKHNG
jgi:hypothetical protein